MFGDEQGLIVHGVSIINLRKRELVFMLLCIAESRMQASVLISNYLLILSTA